FPQYKKAFSTYYFKEDDENHKLSEITRIHFLELGKIDITKKSIEEMTPHERLGAYFKYAADESKTEFLDQLLEYESEVIALTKPILEEISAEKEMRELEEARKRYRMDVNTAKSVGHREGRSEGEMLKLIGQICKNHQKGRSAESFADILDTSVDLIEKVLATAKELNTYDVEKIYNSMK
ncbi:MAG: hypothetical protein IKD13_04535, partial [Firmicutes bacterium]|nr:hypothetical protein [Bacillota bacterium]